MWEEGEFEYDMMKHGEKLKKLIDEDNEKRRRAEEEDRCRNDANQSGGGSFANSGATGGGLILLGVAGFVLYKIYKFIQANWVYIVTILAICIVCAIVCVIIFRRARNPGLKTLFAVLTSAGLIFAVIFFGPTKKDEILNKLQNVTISQEELTTMYANVVSDVLNVRNGPSAEQDIVGKLTKDTLVEVIDNGGRWWKIKSGNIEGYVNSDFLRR